MTARGLVKVGGPLQRDALKPADTSSPRATLQSFIDSCNEAHQRIKADRFYDRTSSEHRPRTLRILDCLDVSELPEYEHLYASGEAAVCLKEILDRSELPPYDEIPDAEAIEAAGGVEELSRWRIPGTRITIARAEEGPQRHEYLFSPGTIERAVEYYQDVQSLPYRTTGHLRVGPPRETFIGQPAQSNILTFEQSAQKKGGATSLRPFRPFVRKPRWNARKMVVTDSLFERRAV